VRVALAMALLARAVITLPDAFTGNDGVGNGLWPVDVYTHSMLSPKALELP